MALSSGTRLGAYEIVSAIGSGGMGDVYRARDTRLDRSVAIKILREEVATEPERLQRFDQEARAASALNHPNILTIYEVGREGAVAYIAMEWVDGPTLRDVLKSGPLPMRRLLKIAGQIAEGLAKAHASGVIHRDLKPENVMITDEGLAKIVDFGLAKLAAAHDESMTRSGGTLPGVVMGTVGYMSPEQASGRAVDHRSDQFAFGLIVYEMATGRRPFQRHTAAQTMAATIEVDPPPIRELNPDVPEHLALVVDRCLTKDPNGRYDSTRDLARDLEQIVGSAAIRVTTSTSRVAGPAGRRARWVAAVAALAVLGALGAMARLWNGGTNSAKPSEAPLVAVREFRNLSADGAHSHFAVGMTEEIRGQLSKIAALRLLSRAAVEKYRDDDAARMVAELGVGSIVDGSVRLDRDRVRVSVELVDARTGHMLWSDQYERQVADVFAVQSEVALRIAGALQANLTPAERARVQKRPTDNLEAYDLYLKSQEMTPLADYGKNVAGMELLTKALALDPRFAVAKSRLAYRNFFLSYRGDVSAVDRAIALAREAADIDPTLAYPHFVLGSAYGVKGQDAQARLAFMRALELDPNHAVTMSNLSFHEYLSGRLDDSLMWARRMFALSDRTGNAYYHVAVPLCALRDDELCGRWVTDAERRAPRFPRVELVLAYVELMRGDGPAALVRMRRAAERWPGDDEIRAARAELAYLNDTGDAETLAAEIAKTTPDIIGSLIGLGSRVRHAYFLKRRGDARGIAEADEVLRRGREQLAIGQLAHAHLNLAAAFMLREDPGAALESLNRAVQSGYRDYGFLTPDPIFASLASDARFKSLIDEMKADVERQRRRAADRGLLDLESLAPGIK